LVGRGYGRNGSTLALDNIRGREKREDEPGESSLRIKVLKRESTENEGWLNITTPSGAPDGV